MKPDHEFGVKLVEADTVNILWVPFSGPMAFPRLVIYVSRKLGLFSIKIGTGGFLDTWMFFITNATLVSIRETATVLT